MKSGLGIPVGLRASLSGAHFLISEWSRIKRKPISCSSFDNLVGMLFRWQGYRHRGGTDVIYTFIIMWMEVQIGLFRGRASPGQLSFWSLSQLRGQVPLTSLNPRPPAGDTQSFMTVSSPLKLQAQMPFRIVLHTVFFIVFRLNQEYIQKKLNLNNFLWYFSRNLFATRSLCTVFERASDFVFFKLCADRAASALEKEQQNGQDHKLEMSSESCVSLRIPSDQLSTLVGGSESRKTGSSFHESTQKEKSLFGPVCSADRIFGSFVFLPGVAAVTVIP